MPEQSFSEVVGFDWQVGSTTTAADTMIANLARVEDAMKSVDRLSQETFASIGNSVTPAINSTIQLNANLAMILANINSINATGGIKVPVSGGGGGGSTASQVRDMQTGQFVSASTMLATMAAWANAPATNARGPDSPAGFSYNALQNIGGGGDAGRGPNGQFLPGNTSWQSQGRDPLTGAFLSPGDISSGPVYSKPLLGNLGVLGENNPRYQSQSFGNINPIGISQAENDLRNMASAAETLPQWLRNLLGNGGAVATRPGTGFTTDFGSAAGSGTIYGNGSVLGGLLGPGQTTIPGYGSSFGLNGGLWGNGQSGPGATINNGGGFNPYSYNSSNGSFGQQGFGPMGPNGGQGAYQYQQPGPGMQGQVFQGQGNAWGQGWPWNNGVGAGGGVPPNIINGIFAAMGGGQGGGFSSPLGPFGANYQAQYQQNMFQQAGRTLFEQGNMQAGENVMQNMFTPAWIESQKTAAEQTQFTSQAYFNRLGALPPDAGKASQQFYYGEQMQNIGAKLNVAQQKGDYAEIDRLTKSYDDAKKASDGLNESTDVFGNMLGRMATRIAIYAVIFGAINLVTQATKQWVEESLRLEDTQARLSFISGQGIGATQSGFSQAAQYGITPTQAAPGLVTAAQLGLSSQQQQQAGQLSLLAGQDKYNDILIQINRTQQDANNYGIRNVQVMDFIATSYKTATGTVDDYFSALQKGIEVGGQFGVSATTMGLAIEKASNVSGQSIDNMGALYQSLLSKVQTPTIQKSLEPWGVTAGTPRDMISQINDLMQRMQANGQTAGIQQLMETAMGSGPGAFVRITNLPAAIEALNNALNGTAPALTKADALIANLGDTGTTKIHMLTAAWGEFLLSMGNTDPIKNAASFLASGLGRAAAGNAAQTDINQMSDSGKMDMLKQYVSETGGGSLRRLFDVQNGKLVPGKYASDFAKQPGAGDLYLAGSTDTGEQLMADVSSYQQWVAAGKPSGTGAPSTTYSTSPSGPHGTGYMGYTANNTSPVNVPSTIPVDKFGGITNIPIGTDMKSFEALVNSTEAILGKQGVPITDKTVLFYDKATNTWDKMQADSAAIRIATETIASQTPSFGGLLPKGETTTQIQKLIDQYAPVLRAAGLGIGEPDKVITYLDTATGTLKSIHGTATEIQLATQLSAKLLQQQITGTFNVPSGGEAVVAFYALQQGFGPNGQGAGGNSSAALNGSASQLNIAALALQAAAATMRLDAGNQGQLGYLMAHAQADGTSSTAFHTPATSNYKLINPNATNPMGYPGEFHTPGTSNYSSIRAPGSPIGPMGGGTQTISPQSFVINNSIRVSIDGQQVAYAMNRKTYRQFESIRNGVSGSPNSVVGM